jgi:ATP-dependent Clp endopeptidase proteolytic subunit ClpP
MTLTTALSLEELEKRKLIAEIGKLETEAQKISQDAVFGERANREKDADANTHRTYTFYEAVKGVSVKSAMDEIGKWARREPGATIKIVLNSPGGSVLDGLALYDFLKILREDGHRVEVVALGMAASMGGVLLQAGTTRHMGKNSWLLIHEVSAGAIGNVSEMEDQIQFLHKIQDNLVDILAERSTLSARQIKSRWKKKDWWLSAPEALELGFIDETI